MVLPPHLRSTKAGEVTSSSYTRKGGCQTHRRKRKTPVTTVVSTKGLRAN